MLKLAQEGLFCTENDSGMPLGPLAEGWKEYVFPATTLIAGVPEIVGAGGGVEGGRTWIPNGGSPAVLHALLAAITMSE